MSQRNLELYEAFALDALSRCTGPVTAQQIIEIADPRDREKLYWAKMVDTLQSLVSESFVKREDATRVNNSACHSSAHYSITALGRARYSGQSPFGELHASARAEAAKSNGHGAPASCAQLDARDEPRRAPIQVTICDAPEPPATAAVCIDEDELDDWWETLDVEQKADAFTGFSLRMYSGESHVHLCDHPRIPVAGTIGEQTPAEAVPAGNGVSA